MGNADRGARVVLGLLILGWGWYTQNYWGFLGFVPLITAAIKWCPAYVPFKISTCKKGQREIG